MAGEAHAALERPGLLASIHDRFYRPHAEAHLAEAVTAARAQGANGSPAELAAALTDVLKRVGLDDGGRPERALDWARREGIGNLTALHMLLQLQASFWRGFLEAIAPTKSFHKMRIATQLKRATGIGWTYHSYEAEL